MPGRLPCPSDCQCGKHNFSAEHRQKLSEAAKGNQKGKANAGRVHSPEVRARMNQANIGKKASLETKAKMTESQKKRWLEKQGPPMTKEQHREAARHRMWVRRLRGFGLTEEMYEALMEQQEGRCPICLTPVEDLGRRLAVDHDHETGMVRGLLCAMCNSGLGLFEDNPDFLLRAVEYLAKNRVPSKEGE